MMDFMDEMDMDSGLRFLGPFGYILFFWSR